MAHHPTGMARPLTEVLARAQRGRQSTRTLLMQEPTEHDDLTAALLDAVALFEALEIEYALVGGLAAMVYGRSRYTEDVDFVAAEGHRERLNAAPDVMRKHGFDPSCTWKLYHRTGVEIDIWKDEHASAIARRAQSATLAGRAVRIADAVDLVAMKLRADRPQDDYDISEIVTHTLIDDAALRERVTDEQWARFEAIRQRIADR